MPPIVTTGEVSTSVELPLAVPVPPSAPSTTRDFRTVLHHTTPGPGSATSVPDAPDLLVESFRVRRLQAFLHGFPTQTSWFSSSWT